MKTKECRRILSVLLTFCLVLSLFPAAVFAAEDVKDIDGHWAKQFIETCHTYGIMIGDGKGNYKPDADITRAEFATMVNKAFGYNTLNVPELSGYTDVPSGTWYAGNIRTAIALGIIAGYSKSIAAPVDKITREQAAVILTKVLRLTPDRNTPSEYTDIGEVSCWAYDAVLAMEQAGYVFDGGSQFMPMRYITRGETAQFLFSIFGLIVDSDFDAQGASYQNVTIRKPGVSLSNINITGDLFITEGVGDGDVWLRNVSIKGRLLAAGGGENSILADNLTVGDNVVVDKPPVAGEQPVRFRAIQTSDNTIIFEGTAREVIITDDIIIIIDNDGERTVFNMFKPEDGENSKPKIIISEGAVVDKIVTTVPTAISGEGSVNKVEVQSEGVEIGGDVKTEIVEAEEGVEIIVGGEIVNGTGINDPTTVIPAPSDTTEPSPSPSPEPSPSPSPEPEPSPSPSPEPVVRYRISFNANGGSGSMSSITGVINGTSLTLPSNSFTRLNYDFTGWAETASGGVVYADGATVTVTSNITLYAVWTVSLVPVVNTPETDAAFTYDGSTYDLSERFSIDANAGAATYSIEPGSTGAGSISGNTLTVTRAGTFIVGLTTAATPTHAAGAKITALLTVNPLAVTVTPNSNSKIYGDSDPTLTYSVTLIGNDVLSGVLDRAAGENAGSYAITLGTLANDNYTLTLGGSAVLTINKKTVTITAGTPNKKLIPFDSADTVYGKTSTFSVTVSGLIGTDTVTVGFSTTFNGLDGSAVIGANGGSLTCTLANSINSFTNTPVLKITSNNYVLSGTPTVTVEIFEGSSTRPIPLTQANIMAFNEFSKNGDNRYYILTEDIDLSGETWVPLGNTSSWLTAFRGSFDGNGHTIENLTINQPNSDCQGMFGYIYKYNTDPATVKNLTLKNVDITGDWEVGAIVGNSNGGTIQNCSASGEINGNGGYIGGLVGWNYYGIVKNSCSKCAVEGSSDVGGIAGRTQGGSITNCYSTGSITGTYDSVTCVGGIAGVNDNSTIEYCYVIGNVNTDGEYVGGIVGQNIGIVRNCIALNETVLTAEYYYGEGDISLGRIAGSNNGILSNNYAWSGMVLTANSIPKVTVGDALDDVDGLGISEAYILTQAAWLAAGFDFADTWVWDDSGANMPSLKGAGAAQPWPDHLDDSASSPGRQTGMMIFTEIMPRKEPEPVIVPGNNDDETPDPDGGNPGVNGGNAYSGADGTMSVQGAIQSLNNLLALCGSVTGI